MHILLIHEIFTTLEEGGGTRHYEFGKYLVEKGHKVTVITGNVEYLSGKRRNKRREKRGGMEIIYAPTIQSVHRSFIMRGLAFLFFSLTSLFEGLSVKNVDIIMGTSPPLFQALSGYILSRIKRKKFVYEVRDLWVDSARDFNVIKNKTLFLVLKMLERSLYRKADLIIINSPGFINYISPFTDSEKIALIPNGVDVESFNLPVKDIYELKNKFNLSNKFVVLYAGNLGVANDMDTILDTAKSLMNFSNILFILIGGGIRKKYVEERIKKEKIENVMVLNSVPKRDIPKYISVADICLATMKDKPSVQIVYPNKVFDYMAAGKPVITTIRGPVREIIEKFKCGTYVPPENPEELKKVILEYYKGRKSTIKEGENAKNCVKEYFNRKKIAKKLENVLLKILNNDIK